MIKIIVHLLKQLEWGSAIACRLTQWTGKAPVPIHPKHLVDFGQLYYLPHLKPTDRVLDLGCHAGEHAFKAAPHVKQVIGVDINLLAHGRCPRNVKFLTGDLEKKLPFASHQFTKVFFFAVLEHIRRRDQLLAEINRVLTPDGQLFISVPNKNTAWKKLQRSVGLSGFSDLDHKLEFSRNQITYLLRRHQFSIVDLQTTALDTPLTGLIDFVGGLSLTLYKILMRWKINQGKLHPKNTVGFLIVTQKL
jgi:SAM-dependent methyltransferase